MKHGDLEKMRAFANAGGVLLHDDALGIMDQLERVRRNGLELADAAELLLSTTSAERQTPSIWFPRVDRVKLAIKVMRGEIPHGHDRA